MCRLPIALALGLWITCAACRESVGAPAGGAPAGNGAVPPGQNNPAGAGNGTTTPASTTKGKTATAPAGLTYDQMNTTVVSCLYKIAATREIKLSARLNAVDSLAGLPALVSTTDTQQTEYTVVTALKDLLCRALPAEAGCPSTPAPPPVPAHPGSPANPNCGGASASDCTCTNCSDQDFFCQESDRAVFVLHVVQALGNLGPPAVRALDAIAKATEVNDPVVQAAIVNAQLAILTAPAPTQNQNQSQNQTQNPSNPTGGSGGGSQASGATIPVTIAVSLVSQQAAAAPSSGASSGVTIPLTIPISLVAPASQGTPTAKPPGQGT
jgi:hypothetical protein